ncbi:hypothetical protein ACXYMO_01750 [Arenibacterium sp. CAU 1754]
MNRNFVELIQVLGGRDEYTKEELDGLQRQFLAVYPTDFSDSAVTKVTDLGSGFCQEMRIYWNENTSYTFFYALLHDTNDHLVVLNFLLNSSSTPVLDKF